MMIDFLHGYYKLSTFYRIIISYNITCILIWPIQMFLSGHYAGQDLVPKWRGGEPWKKVFGPVYIYLNSGSTDPLVLWEDAKIKVYLMHISLVLLLFEC